MSDTVIEKLEDLDFIIQDYIYLSGQKGVNINEETFNNMWAFSLSEDFAQSTKLIDLKKFLSDLLKRRKEQIKELNIESKITFYMWIDEMLTQLRFNFISGEVANLPFKCTLNIVDSPDFILQRFLKESKKTAEKGGGLLFEDMIILEPGDEGWDDEMWYKNSDPKDYTLDVYVITIP